MDAKTRDLVHKQDLSIELEILQASYWEHFKQAKELSLYLPISNSRRRALEREITKMQIRIKELENGY